MADCRIVGAFDTETTNIGNALEGYEAFPILYQYGRVKYNVEGLTPENVFKHVEVSIARNENEIYACFDKAITDAAGYYVPVILVHNLGFDMYALAPYLRSHNVRVLAKTAKKPISFQVLGENGKPALIFLDTLGLFMKSLKVLGDECGMPKAVGDWDYSLVRTCKTELTEAELGYAKQDVYTLLCYMAYFLRQNPDIKQADIGNRVQTKTGVVRAKRLVHVGNTKARNASKSVRQLWHLLNQEQRPKSDDELFTMQAATRGGYTFCARNNASRVYVASDDLAIESYDSTSQHPAQMVSHLYPQRFKEASAEQLGLAFSICSNIGVERLLKAWLKPFPFAFYAAFEFENLRPKEGSVFAREGIFPLASARIGGKAPVFDNEAASEFKDYSASLGYGDRVSNPTFAYGKLEACDHGVFYLTELDAWILSRSYDWDSVRPLHGYMSSTFRKAPDMAVLSVMRYYGAKDALKWFMETYKEGQEHDVSKISNYYPARFVSRCKSGQAEYSELKELYMLAKADLNSLFGIEATNECRRDYEMHDANGLELVGTDGIHNLPKSSKAFYQFGQRIVGWSRVAQVCIMELVAPYVKSIICGDTDSIKIAFDPANRPLIERELKKHARYLDRAKHAATARARAAYKNLYIPLKGIGHYVFDGAYEAFSASWNKSYIGLVNGKCKLTIAGMPTTRRSLERDDSFNDFCNDLLNQGLSFKEVASLAIGYNVTIDASISKLNARLHPQEFGGRVFRKVTDYRGNTDIVDAPAALALFPFPKTLGDTSSIENARNMAHALANNPDVNTSPVLLRWDNGKAIIER